MSTSASWYRWGGGVFVACAASALLVSVAAAGESLSLDEALALAHQNNPDLLAARQEIGVAAGREERARYLNPFNPEIGAHGAHREFSNAGGGPEYGVTASQEIEVAGQRGKRIDEAERNTERVAASVRDRERLLDAEVRRAFYDVLAARQRLALQQEVERLDQRTLDATNDRVTAGEAPRLAANLAAIRWGQSRRDTIEAETAVATAGLGLKRLLGLPPERALDPAGELRGTPEAPTVPEALADALTHRPDLVAAQAEVERARAELDLWRRLRVPNPTLEAFYQTEAERDGGREAIAGGGVRIPIPVFDRKQAEMTALAAQERQARHLLERTRRAIEQEVNQALREYEAASRVLAVMESRVLDPVRETFGFLETAYRESKIDLMQMIVVQNDLVHAQMSYVDALLTFRRAEINVGAAIGTSHARPVTR